MQPQRKSAAFEAERHPLASSAGYDLDHEPLVKVGEGIYARALQHRLVDAFEPTVEDEKLPVPQRLAVIVGLTAALWLMIGSGVYLMF